MLLRWLFFVLKNCPKLVYTRSRPKPGDYTQTFFNLKRKYSNYCCPTKTNFIFYVIGITLVYGPHRGLTFVTISSPENQ
jgi:hypothetical protein